MRKQITILISFILLQQNLLYSQKSKEDSLLQIVALNKQDDNEMKALVFLAIGCFRNNPEKAKTYLYPCLEMAIPANNFYRQAGAYSLLISLHQEAGLMDSASWYVNKLIAVAEKAPDDKKVQGNYNQAVGLYYRKKSEYKTAMPYLMAAATYSEESGSSKTDIAGQWLNVGNTYSNLGDYNNAMAYHLKALGYFEQAGNKLGESFCYNSIAVAFSKLKQFSKALEYSEKSLALKKLLNDKRGVCVSELQMGEIYMSTRNFEAALQKFETSLKLSAEEDMLSEEAKSRYNMAKIFTEQKKDSLAISLLKKTKVIAHPSKKGRQPEANRSNLNCQRCSFERKWQFR
jgi:tetratricopeptide (TPR) repeat protein